MSITNSSVLVELNMSLWTANKLDRGATHKVAADNSASSKAVKVHKNLMEGSTLRNDIANLATACRAWHLARTLPWTDGGQRLLPTSLFLDYKTEMNTFKALFDSKVDEFIDKYPALVQTAQNYLGNLFNPDDYPSADEVRSKFGFRLTFSPVPEAGDFRLDVPASALAELSQQYEENFKTRMAEAMREPWDKLRKTLVAMTEKLTDKEGDDKKRYHETLIGNIQEMCSMLTHLNITKDPKLEEARREVERMLAGTSIDLIRESAMARATTKSKVDAILKQFEW
jgi:hypothetical protein